jgi:hypothetical protein
MSSEAKDPAASHDELTAGRRRFLASCGRFAMITPPTMTLLLAVDQQGFAVAGSGAAGSGSLSGGRTFFPGDDIAGAGGAKPGDKVCFNVPGGGTSCHGIPEPPK